MNPLSNLVQLYRRGRGGGRPLKGFYQHGTHIHASSGIKTCNPSVRAAENHALCCTATGTLQFEAEINSFVLQWQVVQKQE
jgi:hypothetical protein